ncbi:RNA polymerase sigma factor [Arenicella xantha]|uniref:RNA polymerase sigma-70 factor (ECF subfamily) n=1 Tax=Arenicella xantha TaxID=644221 RepID=A0A395JMG7_9GAMM|nr:sigma-70 family RNA polymerase sigma factor [Arenicella xantha]RBP52841.1 RNA polymerase sigma-70 factor (ECF subfamily) [Arenicella xantha]
MHGRNSSIQYQRFQQVVAEDVLRDAKRGDSRAHGQLYKTYSRAIFTLALGICGSTECAEDVLHNTFIQLINKLPSYEGRAPLGMWLRQIAVNESLMYLRKHKKHNVVVSSDEFSFFEQVQDTDDDQHFPSSSDDFAQRLGDQTDMTTLLNKLPEDMRMILWLKEVEGYTHNEIAGLVDKTPSYSKSVVARALQFLRERIPQSELLPTVGEH